MDENMLKQKYNDLLESLKKGEEYLKENPNDEKGQKRMEEIAKEMENIVNAFPNITADEINNGFKIEQQSKQVNEQVSEQVSGQVKKENKNVPQETQIQMVQKNNIVENYSNNWKLAERLSKSSIIPKEFQGKPENILLCMGMSEKMGLDLITVVNNLQMVMRTPRMER